MTINEAISNKINEKIPVQTFWAEVTEVEQDSCNVKRLTDELEFDNVLFGLGDNFFIPKQGSKVLCGIIHNQPLAFLLYIEQIDKVILNSNEILLKSNIKLGGDNGEKAVKGQTLNRLLQQILIYLQTLNAGLITYASTQANELPAIAGSNTALASLLGQQTALLSQYIGQLPNHLAQKVTVK